MASKESSYGKTHRNLKTEDRARSLLLESNPHFQQVDPACRKRILELLGLTGRYTTRSFDLVETAQPMSQLGLEEIDGVIDSIRLVELKGTQKPVKDESLRGFFFGATENEFNLAKELGDRYRFAFVVLNDDNTLGRPFYVLLTLEELEARIRTKRRQYQINL